MNPNSLPDWVDAMSLLRRAGWSVGLAWFGGGAGYRSILVQVTSALRRAGHALPAFHPVELVDASLRGADAGELLRQARR